MRLDIALILFSTVVLAVSLALLASVLVVGAFQ